MKAKKMHILLIVFCLLLTGCSTYEPQRVPKEILDRMDYRTMDKVKEQLTDVVTMDYLQDHIDDYDFDEKYVMVYGTVNEIETTIIEDEEFGDKTWYEITLDDNHNHVSLCETYYTDKIYKGYNYYFLCYASALWEDDISVCAFQYFEEE